MFKTKCIYILVIVCALIAMIFVTEGQDTSSDELEQQMIEEQMENSSQVGIVVETQSEESTLCWYIAQFNASGFLVILIGIFISIFACSEHDSGFLKNLAPCSQHKWQIIVARLIPGFLTVIILQIAFFLSLIGVNLIYGNPIPLGSILELLPVIGVQILLHTAFAAFILLVVEITRNLLVSILVSIFTGFGFAGLLVAFVAQPLTNYMILSRIKLTDLPFRTEFLPATLIIGVVTLVGYLVLSGLIFQKRDTY